SKSWSNYSHTKNSSSCCKPYRASKANRRLPSLRRSVLTGRSSPRHLTWWPGQEYVREITRVQASARRRIHARVIGGYEPCSHSRLGQQPARTISISPAGTPESPSIGDPSEP